MSCIICGREMKRTQGGYGNTQYFICVGSRQDESAEHELDVMYYPEKGWYEEHSAGGQVPLNPR